MKYTGNNAFHAEFSTETQLLSSDLATLLGVGVGMTLFCGLTCLILRLFARARFGPRHHHYANAHLAPPITLSTDHGKFPIFLLHTTAAETTTEFNILTLLGHSKVTGSPRTHVYSSRSF